MAFWSRCILGFAIAFFVILPFSSRSQEYEGGTCDQPGNPGLRADLGKGVIAALETYGGNYAKWATSLLTPSGKPPAKPKPGDDEAAMGYAEALGKWSCQYSPGNAQDGNSATAWVEGVAGNGEGEILIVQVNTRKAVEIWTGFGKSSALFAANSRPRKVQIRVLQSLVIPNPNQVGYAYRDIVVLNTRDVDLADTNGYQPLSLPEHTLREGKGLNGGPWPLGRPEYDLMTFVAIEILSAYPGAKYQDTAITEVRNAPANKK